MTFSSAPPSGAAGVAARRGLEGAVSSASSLAQLTSLVPGPADIGGARALFFFFLGTDDVGIAVLTELGDAFSNTYHDKNHGAIHESIEAMDRLGMEIIETGDPDAFKRYLQEYENTICGRHPISVLLHMLKHCSTKIKVGFVRYEQSSQCKSMRDSSVSYASAAAKVDSPGEESKD